MTDFTGAGAPTSPLDTSGQDEDSQPGIRILAQYVRDLSFENPRAPDSLRAGTVPPQIDLGVELGARGRDDGLFEIELKLTARAMRETKSVFHIELAYAGLFQLTAVPPEEMESVLMIECPRYLFPFARRIIADLSSEGGFPPFMLEPIDFAALYIARRNQSVGETVGNA